MHDALKTRTLDRTQSRLRLQVGSGTQHPVVHLSWTAAWGGIHDSVIPPMPQKQQQVDTILGAPMEQCGVWQLGPAP